MSDSPTPPAHDGSDQPYPQQPYPQQPYAYQGYPQQPYAQQGYGRTTPYIYPRNDLAVWSLVLGIASFVLGCMFVTGIPAVILGGKAKSAAESGEADNPGLATAGIVLGWVSIGLSALSVLVIVVLFVGMASFGQAKAGF